MSVAEAVEIAGNIGSAVGGLVALVGVPLAIWQLRSAERQRALNLVEQSVFDHFARLETCALDTHIMEIEQPAQFAAATAELRRLVALLALLEQRNRMEAIEPETVMLHIKLQVAYRLALWRGFIAGYLSGFFQDGTPATDEDSIRAVEAVLALYSLSVCDEVSPRLNMMINEAVRAHDSLIKRAREYLAVARQGGS